MISSGTIASSGAGETDHIGVVQLRDSTTADGGYRHGALDLFLLNGTENGTHIFRKVTARTTTKYKMGFQDSATVLLPVDGCWIEAFGDSLMGRCTSNIVGTNTSTNFTIHNWKWYKSNVYVNPTASIVTFTLMNSTQVNASNQNGGASSQVNNVLWTDTISTNIPTAAGRDTSFLVIATESTTDAAAGIIDTDMIELNIARAIPR